MSKTIQVTQEKLTSLIVRLAAEETITPEMIDAWLPEIGGALKDQVRPIKLTALRVVSPGYTMFFFASSVSDTELILTLRREFSEVCSGDRILYNGMEGELHQILAPAFLEDEILDRYRGRRDEDHDT